MDDSEKRWVNSDGYVMVVKGGMLHYQHRLVWEAAHGRPIPTGHVVHHRDGDKRNNDPANLEVMKRGDHIREHARQRREARQDPHQS